MRGNRERCSPLSTLPDSPSGRGSGVMPFGTLPPVAQTPAPCRSSLRKVAVKAKPLARCGLRPQPMTAALAPALSSGRHDTALLARNTVE
jgi:hypothetical protein